MLVEVVRVIVGVLEVVAVISEVVPISHSFATVVVPIVPAGVTVSFIQTVREAGYRFDPSAGE